MAHSFEASMPTPSPDSRRLASGTRYRRDQFPPVPKSVRIMTISSKADVSVEAAPELAEKPIAGPNMPKVPNPNGSPAKWVTIFTGVVGVLVLLRGCGAVVRLAWQFIDYVKK